MKILLTGANGYVGSELLRCLLAEGHAVHGITRSERALPGLPPERRIVHDLRRPLPVLATDFDLVIHAAGANDVQSRDPAAALELTVLTARHCADFAIRQRQPRLLYLSTFQVYGTDEGDVDENTACLPRNDYAGTHLYAEQWIAQYGRTQGLRHVLLRPANIAGIPQAGEMLRWTLTPGCFCRDAVAEQRILVRSTGRQFRDFLPLPEVARRAARVAGEFDSWQDGPLNLCAGVALTIGDVATAAVAGYHRAFGHDCRLEFVPPPDSPAADPVPLRVGGAYLARYPAERYTREQAQAAMAACIDQTYAYLKNHPEQTR